MNYLELSSRLADIISDYNYKANSNFRPNQAHVDKWIRQFSDFNNCRESVLYDLCTIFEKSYFSKEKIKKIIIDFIDKTIIAENILPETVYFLDCTAGRQTQTQTQPRKSESQSDLRILLREIIEEKYPSNFGNFFEKNKNVESFVYIDDFLFTGKTLIDDIDYLLSEDILKDEILQKKAHMFFFFIGIYSYNYYKIKENLIKRKFSVEQFTFYSEILHGNGISIKHPIDVLRPRASVLEDNVINEFYKNTLSSEKFIFRTKQNHSDLFLGVENLDIIEKSFLKEAIKFNPNTKIPPLGFTSFRNNSFGFGSMLATYRNAPNNMPICIWQTIGNWYPLLPRNIR